MSKKVTNIPKLRFPEFREMGEWEGKSLGELGKFTGGGTPSKSNHFYWQGYIPWVSSSDIPEDSIYELKINRFITNEALTDSATKLVPKNSILIVSRVGVGKLAVSKNAVCTSQDFTSFTPKSDNLFFLAYYLKTCKKYLLECSQGMAIKGFTKENISNLNILIPSKKEQQKIAACLSSLDDLITAHTQKLDALKAHKKGLMQQLFPAEGETVPKLRFPEFREMGEWEEKEFSEIAEFYKGKNISKADIDPQGEIQCIRYGELYTHYNEIIRTVFSKTKLSSSNLFFSKKNDVLIPSSGEKKQDISTASCLMLDNIALGGDINIIRSKQDGKFISYYLNGYKRLEIAKIAQGDTVVHLYTRQLKLINLMLPSQKEQQKIVACLSSLDDLITAQAQKIQALKTHKKGLMQQLFPRGD